MKVIAAIDQSPAARPVLAAAGAVATLFDASLEALHVREDGWEAAAREARAAGVELRVVEGEPVDEIARAGRRADVGALVMGARATPGGRRPAGHTSLEVITSVGKPVVVVPPGAAAPWTLGRILAPMDGTAEGSEAVKGAIDIACHADVEVVVAHVHDESHLPMFDEQPQHETEAWAGEFLARHCPEAAKSLRMEVRVGVPARQIVDLASDTGCDLVVVAWHQDLSPGRAQVVRELLDRSEVPLILMPVEEDGSARGRIAGLRTGERP